MCDKAFSYSADLYSRMKVHTERVILYTCLLCKKRYIQSEPLQIHKCDVGLDSNIWPDQRCCIIQTVWIPYVHWCKAVDTVHSVLLLYNHRVTQWRHLACV